MIDSLAESWLWIVLVVAFIVLHLGMNRGHGGHGVERAEDAEGGHVRRCGEHGGRAGSPGGHDRTRHEPRGP